MVELLTVGAIGVVTGIGLILLLFGFEIAKPLLGAGGALAGAVVGGGIGLTVVPPLLGGLQFEAQLLAGAGGVVVGALIGYAFVPLVGRLTAAVAGSAGTALATAVVLTGEEVLDAVLEAIPDDPIANPGRAIERIGTAPVFEQAALQETLAVAVGVGFIGGLLALRYYTDIVALVATSAGAALLGVVIPLWIMIITEGAVDPTLSEFSMVWFGVAFVVGVVFQLTRHFDALNPRSGDANIRG